MTVHVAMEVLGRAQVVVWLTCELRPWEWRKLCQVCALAAETGVAEQAPLAELANAGLRSVLWLKYMHR